MNKLLHNPCFIFEAGLKSAGVVENILVMVGMVRKDQFVFDIMFATLKEGSSR
jgi:hypothetical protein